jgi:hypothetical protein
MTTKQRMSPLTAFFIGLFGLGTVAIIALGLIVLYGMVIADTQIDSVLDTTSEMVSDTVEGLPALIDALPPIVTDPLSDRRAPEYAEKLVAEVNWIPISDGQYFRPAVTVTNKGDEMVTLLSLRVAALDGDKRPLADWTEVVATPFTIEDENWRGPLMPGQTRHALLYGRYKLKPTTAEKTVPAIEITDVRVWDPEAKCSRGENVKKLLSHAIDDA